MIYLYWKTKFGWSQFHNHLLIGFFNNILGVQMVYFCNLSGKYVVIGKKRHAKCWRNWINLNSKFVHPFFNLSIRLLPQRVKVVYYLFAKWNNCCEPLNFHYSLHKPFKIFKYFLRPQKSSIWVFRHLEQTDSGKKH